MHFISSLSHLNPEIEPTFSCTLEPDYGERSALIGSDLDPDFSAIHSVRSCTRITNYAGKYRLLIRRRITRSATRCLSDSIYRFVRIFMLGFAFWFSLRDFYLSRCFAIGLSTQFCWSEKLKPQRHFEFVVLIWIRDGRNCLLIRYFQTKCFAPITKRASLRSAWW